METFEWTPLFETGLAIVDRQHQQLVNLINQLGMGADEANPEHIDQTLVKLTHYTVYHFQSEEEIMTRARVAATHADKHRATHRQFIAQVAEWTARRERQEAVNLRQLLDFLSNWLIFHILGDDQSLSRQVKAIQAGGDPQTVYDNDHGLYDPRTDVVLGALHHLYCDLVDRNEELQQTQRTLSQLNTALEQRVAERTAELLETNRRLREEQERVLEAEKMASLDRMVAGFAHELNTPIGVAVGAASHSQEVVEGLSKLISRDEVDENDLRQRLGMLTDMSDLALSNLRRAAEMVRSFKRTVVDQASEQEREYKLAEIVEDVRVSLRHVFKNRRIAIDGDCPPDLVLFGPAGALAQTLTNLLQNSLKHAFADGARAGRIRIAAHTEGNQVCIVHADDGAGMPEETLQHAFEPFYTTRRAAGGSGLGLYIAYNLVTQALRGTIRCESTVGEGTRFFIEIPRRIPAKRVNTP